MTEKQSHSAKGMLKHVNAAIQCSDDAIQDGAALLGLDESQAKALAELIRESEASGVDALMSIDDAFDSDATE